MSYQDIPLVSICIPAYNAEKFIGDMLFSILNQTYTNLEIIVADNNSTDNTKNIVQEFQKKDYRIKYIKNPTNVGFAQNCNQLINIAKGKYIALYHADDTYEPTIIEKEVHILETYSELKGVFTYSQWINHKNQKIKSHIPKIVGKKKLHIIDLDCLLSHILLKGGICFCTPSSMIRKETYKQLLGYDISLKYIEDQDMWARILTLGNMAIIPEKLMNYRIHIQQGSSYYTDIRRNSLSVVITHIEKFIVNNGLYSQYEEKIKISKAKDYLKMARFAIQLKNYQLFIEKTNQSKKSYKFNLNTIIYFQKIKNKYHFSVTNTIKSILFQRIPFLHILYMQLKLVVKFKK